MDTDWSRHLAQRKKPRGLTVMRQSWKQLLFLHWSMPPELLHQHLPEGLELELFDGKAWLAIVPFWMQAVRPACCPPIPWLSHFLELNVRTYVLGPDGTPGVWFFSLDCNRRPAVEVARRCFHLNYQRATMKASTRHGLDYSCRRLGERRTANYQWSPPSCLQIAEPGSLEFFLLERYVLFSWNPKNRQLHTGRVHHEPYPFGPTGLSCWSEAPIGWNGLPLPARPPDHVVASPGVDVRVYPLKNILFL